MKRTVCGLLLLAGNALAQEPASTATSVSVIVPVVGSTVGPSDTRWKTDIVLRNDSKTEATVALSLPAAKDQPIILLTIPPGGVQRFTDVVGEAFAMDNVLSPLVVQTLGRRSVRVAASAYAIVGATTTKPQPIPVTDASAYYPVRTLPNVSYSTSRRTNIGIVNLGETEAVLTLALRTPSGENAGAMRAVLGPNSMWHMAVQLLFPAMTKGDNYSVLIETGARDTIVYGSVLDNDTNQATFIAPLPGVH